MHRPELATRAERYGVLAGRVVTADPDRATRGDPLGVITDGGIVVHRGRIEKVGSRDEVLAALVPADAPPPPDSGGEARAPKSAGRSAQPPLLADEPDLLLTPGLCDAHTHAAWMGSRHEEYAARMAGAGYEQIAASGGGIAASARAVALASASDIARELAARLGRMAALGVTTVEVKSGYGLLPAEERKQLHAIQSVAGDACLPRVVPTYLALHALPPEHASDRDGYVRTAIESVAAFAADELMSFVDAYVDRNAFSVAEARPVLAAARAAGLGIRLHVGQFADVGGAELAAELHAASVDHLEHVSEPDLARLAAAGTRAVLLPLASFTLAGRSPPVDAMRRAGVSLVVASDANPGTAPTESLPLALALAVRGYGLTVAEAVLGATREAAASLGLAARTGALRPGLSADFVLWDLPHEAALVQPWGVSRTRIVAREGCVLSPR